MGRLDGISSDVYTRCLSRDLLSPEMFFTNICIVSSASADEAREKVEEIEEMLLERMMDMLAVVIWSSWCYVDDVVKWQAAAAMLSRPVLLSR